MKQIQKNDWLRKVMSFGLPSLLKSKVDNSSQQTTSEQEECVTIEQEEYVTTERSQLVQRIRKFCRSTTLRLSNCFRFDGIFNQNLFIVQCISNFAVLLTFGVVIPPVAVIGCVAIISHTLYIQLLIGRFIAVTQEKYYEEQPRNNVTMTVLMQLESECTGSMEKFASAVWIIDPFAAGFYAMLLFDILGSGVGWQKALWMPFVILSLPFVAHLCQWTYMHVQWRWKWTNNPRYKTLS